MTPHLNKLTLKPLGIDTYKEAVVYLRSDCHICRSEGFEVHARVQVNLNGQHIFATLNTVDGDLLQPGEVSLSKYAWQLLRANTGDVVHLSHPNPLDSLSSVRAKIYGNTLESNDFDLIINDIAKGNYSDIHIATFLTACAGGRLNDNEVIALTKSMIDVGERLTWKSEMIVDKHCVGGLPGNRTTLIVVPIVAAFGLMMPKTSSRAITSPAGTADTMETLAPVELSVEMIKRVVEQENGCIVWGGSVDLSPADDVLIRVERTINLDSEGQLVASVLSKKISAGSTYILIDIPVGPTAKVRSMEMAVKIKDLFSVVAKQLAVDVKIYFSDGTQPVGRGIGPALEARDVLAVLQNQRDAPQDLRDRALTLAGMILEFSGKLAPGIGKSLAEQILTDGTAWKKFQAICDAQGGMRVPPIAKYTHAVSVKSRGRVNAINNRQLARLAKLAGAPHAAAAGITLHTPLNTLVEIGDPLFTIHAVTKGELRYALSLLDQIPEIVEIETQA